MFKLQIATGNDAFAHPGGAYELERILREVGETVRFCVNDASAETASATLRDVNGTTVGKWSLNAPEGEEGAHSLSPEDSGTASRADDYPLPVLIAAKNALFSGGAPDPELADARMVLTALEAAGLLVAAAGRSPHYRPLSHWTKPEEGERAPCAHGPEGGCANCADEPG